MALTKITTDVVDIPDITVALAQDATTGGIKEHAENASNLSSGTVNSLRLPDIDWTKIINHPTTLSGYGIVDGGGGGGSVSPGEIKIVPNTFDNSTTYINANEVFDPGVYTSLAGLGELASDKWFTELLFKEYYNLLPQLNMVFGNGIFVAMSFTHVYTSTNGVNWDMAPIYNNYPFFGNLTFVHDRFFANVHTTQYNTAGFGDTSYLISSTDGITWTKVTMPIDGSYEWKNIAYGGGMFIATIDTNTTTIAKSVDGVTWTSQTCALSKNWDYLVYGNGYFLVTNGSNACSSVDGVTWPGITASINIGHPVLFNDGYFITHTTNSYNTITIYTSPDGATWTSKFSTTMGSNLSAFQQVTISVANGITYVTGYTNTYNADIIVSADAVTWTKMALPSIQYWTNVIYGNSIYFISNNTGSISATSTNGTTWTEHSISPPALSMLYSAFTANIWQNTLFGNGTFIITRCYYQSTISPYKLEAYISANKRTTTATDRIIDYENKIPTNYKAVVAL